MPREIDRNQLNQTLLHINRLIRDLCAEKTGQYPQADYIWNKETQQMWAEVYSRLLAMIQREDFSSVLDTLNDELGNPCAGA
jgi:two-component SAPR family response regulator